MSNYTAWQFWWLVISGLVNAVVWVGVWVCNRDKARSGDIADVKGDLLGVDKRVTRLEDSQINHEDLAKVYERINKVSDQVSNMKGEMTGALGNIGGSVDMILDHMLKEDRRRYD